ncbi:MAG: SpoVG family protein [Clostridia bacterium]|nr:SpoVG family protein [Clostridia bacterium]
MQITDIKIRKTFNDDGPMKAVVSVTFDNQLALHDVKVINTRDKYFIVMPSRKNPDGTYRDIIHPINSDFRQLLEKSVLDEYFAELARIEEGEVTETELLAE